MAINKVVYDNNTLIDLTDSTLAPNDVERGEIFYDASGTRQVGIARAFVVGDYIDTDLDGFTVLYEGENLSFDGTNYIDTNVSLFSTENINKDFKVIIEGLMLDNTKGTGNTGERCLFGSMYEVSPYPGFIIRMTNNAGAGVIGISNNVYYPALVIARTNGVMSFSAAQFCTGIVNNPTGNTNIGAAIMRVGNMGNCTTTHATTVSLGCEKDKNGTPYRFCAGSFERIIIAMAE